MLEHGQNPAAAGVFGNFMNAMMGIRNGGQRCWTGAGCLGTTVWAVAVAFVPGGSLRRRGGPFLGSCLLLGLAWGSVSCNHPPSTPVLSGEVVAVVGDQVISRAALEQHLARRGHTVLTPEGITAALDEMVGIEATYAKARAAGYETNAAVQAAIKRLVAAQFEEEQFKDPGAAPQVTEQEIEGYYQARQTEFNVPERARGAILFLKVPGKATPEKQAEHAATAAAILAEARQLPSAPAGFGALAQKYSEDAATRYQGGDLGWLAKNQPDFRFGPAVTEAIFALEKPGDFTPVLRTKDGLVLVRMMEKAPAGARPLSEVKESLSYRLSRARIAQREAEFRTAMKAGLNIKINRPLFEALARPAPSRPPPSLPGVATVQTNALSPP